jgi:RNA polymerase sigma factor (sigma-70 family)
MIFSQDLMIIQHNHRETPIEQAPLETLPLPQLLLACREHQARFRHGAENDPRFCLELFRRTIEVGDPEAWRGLVDLYQPLLRARLQQQGLAPDMAEEVVQEAFVTFWLQSKTKAFVAFWLKSKADAMCAHMLAQVLNYLWGSMRFALIKLRRQQRDVSLPAESDSHPLLTSNGSEMVIEHALDARALLGCVRKLVTAHEWRVLWLRFGHELPPREIATLLGVPVAEIHTALASAKRRLRSDPQLRTIVAADGSLED